MRRNGLISLLFIVLLAGGGLIGTFAAGNEPLLGLDLQGGVAVVLEPAEDTESDSLRQARDIIRQRVDGLGVAEPEIAIQGDNIIVQLPGVDDRERALELVGQTAELRFRPVLQTLPPLDQVDPESLPEGADLDALDLALTPPEEDDPGATVTLAETDDDVDVAWYQLGPVPGVEGEGDEDDPATLPLTGEVLAGASAELQNLGEWIVAVEIRGDRIDDFNETASACFNRVATCPSGQLAIVLDSEVVSAPSINAASFAADEISISGGFTEGSAKDLALVLRYGALPVELEAQQSQSVSATIGKDALDAGVAAGVVGLALVAVYMLVYYRLLGLVAVLSLAVSASLLWTVIAFLGESQGLALTLAGVTGIIVSIGVAVDSNVVFYEHVKERVSNGRTLRSAVDGSFTSAFSTIVKADVASLIGAGVLYWLTVGPVRGFAFYLGLATIIDLVTSYFFMRPMTLMLAKSNALSDKPRAFGMPLAPSADVAQEGVPA